MIYHIFVCYKLNQIGRDPPIHVWDPMKMQTISILKGQHYRGISAVGFSSTKKRKILFKIISIFVVHF
jgi:hypothetical protein